MNKKSFLTVERMTFIAVFAALTCVCAWIAVPSPFAPGVNFTLQTFAIILTGLLLSPLESLLTSVVYLLLGVVALPVFSGFTTLYSKIGTPAGGYVIGFVIAPFLISLVRNAIEKKIDASSLSSAKQKTVKIALYIALAIVLGILIVDIPGVIQYKYTTNSPWDVATVLGALSFMPTDILKCVLAAVVAFALQKPLANIRGKR